MIYSRFGAAIRIVRLASIDDGYLRADGGYAEINDAIDAMAEEGR